MLFSSTCRWCEENPKYKAPHQYIVPRDYYSGTVRNTQVSARKDGPRAWIAYSIQ